MLRILIASGATAGSLGVNFGAREALLGAIGAALLAVLVAARIR